MPLACSVRAKPKVQPPSAASEQAKDGVRVSQRSGASSPQRSGASSPQRSGQRSGASSPQRSGGATPPFPGSPVSRPTTPRAPATSTTRFRGSVLRAGPSESSSSRVGIPKEAEAVVGAPVGDATLKRVNTPLSNGARTPVMGGFPKAGRKSSSPEAARPDTTRILTVPPPVLRAQTRSGASSPLRPRSAKSESSSKIGRQASQQGKISTQESHASVPGGSAGPRVMPPSAPPLSTDDQSTENCEFASDSSEYAMATTLLVKVYVRVRPQNTAEAKQHQEVVVQTSAASPGTIWIMHQDDHGKEAKPSEHMYDCVLPTETTQDRVYELLGEKTVRAVSNGYHGCVFAYGQTGSGKSHTIFGGGSNDDRGLMPRIAEGIFTVVENSQVESMVTLSYLELYNETPRDLLHPGSAGGKGQKPPQLDVRQHPSYGVFVENLTFNAVENMKDVRRLIDFGNKIRVVGCTNMNASSSRSHAIVTLTVERTIKGPVEAGKKRQRAQLHCVDLAGSERLKQAGDSSLRQTESRQINRSLLALNTMITRLAAKHKHIPWRESKLTLLLSDALMGNCRTAVLACVSPSVGALTSTESTLRFASTVKKIHTKPSKNEEAEGHLIKTLLAEIENLRKQLKDAEHARKEELNAQLAVTQSCCNAVAANWDKRREQSRALDVQRRQTLSQLGLKSSIDGSVGSKDSVDGEIKVAYLVNECDDALLSGTLRYSLPLGKQVTIGSDEGNTIVLTGLGMRPDMCSVSSINEATVEVVLSTDELPCLESWRPVEENGQIAPPQSRSSIIPRSAIRRTTLFQSGIPEVYVNGVRVTHKMQMADNDLLRIGAVHTYRLRMYEASHRHGIPVPQDSQLVSPSCVPEQQESSANQELRGLLSEANMLTEELRGGENIEHEFGIQLLGGVSVNQAAAAVPVVTLSVIERPDEISAAGKPIFSSGGEPCLTAIWPIAKFRERLEMMRDLYEEVQRRDEPWGKPGDVDPWSDTLTVPVVKPKAKASPPSPGGHAGGLLHTPPSSTNSDSSRAFAGGGCGPRKGLGGGSSTGTFSTTTEASGAVSSPRRVVRFRTPTSERTRTPNRGKSTEAGPNRTNSEAS